MSANRAALRLLLTLALGAGAAGVAVAVSDRGGAPAPTALRVAAAGHNAAIEQRAVDHVAAQARAAVAAPGRPSLRALFTRPRVLGLAEVDSRTAVAALRDDVRTGGRTVAVYSVVTLEVRNGVYTPTRSATACDQAGDGLGFAIPLPAGGAVLVATGATSDAAVPFAGRPRTGAAVAFAAWLDGDVRQQDVAAAGLGSGTAACPVA